MKPQILVVLTGVTLLVAQPTLAQTCEHGWLAGPLDNGTAPNGSNQPNTQDSPVTALTLWDPEGDGAPMLVAAGSFTNVQGVSTNRIAARDSITGKWQSLGMPTVFCVPESLVVYNGELIYGGNAFWADTTVGRWTGSDWEPLGGGLPVDNSNVHVRALAVYNGSLYAAGTFSSDANGIHHIARWNGSVWSPLGSGLYPDESGTASVYAMAVYNGELIVAGDFEGAGGMFSPNIARWNGSTWLPMVGGPNYIVAQRIYALTVFNGSLVAGGFFAGAGGQAVQNIARWNGSTWSPLGTGLDGSVMALCVYNSELIAAGTFLTGTGGNAVNRIARWNGSFWNPLGFYGLDEPTATFFEYSLCVLGNELVVGGSFTKADNKSANNLARWNGLSDFGGDWTSFGGGSVSVINALAPLGNSQIVIGGDLSQSTGAGPAAHNIATWDGQTLLDLDGGVNDVVLALKAYTAVSTNYLVVGGGFTKVGSEAGIGGGVAGGSAIPANRIAKWSSDFFNGGWSALGNGFNSNVLALEWLPANQFFTDAIFAGGEFTAAGDGSQTFNRAAVWTGSPPQWFTLGTGFNNRVRALKGFNSGPVARFLYAGGDFTTASGISANRIAYYPIPNQNGWVAMGSGFNGTVNAIERHNGSIYAGGAFTLSGATPISHVARWTGTAWENVDGGLGGTVFALSSFGGKLYASSADINGLSVAAWDGTSWASVDGGVTDGYAYAIAPFKSELIVGGLFFAAQGGDVETPNLIARNRLQGIPWIVKQPVSQTVSCGSNVTFNVEVCTGYEDVDQYQWLKDGVPLAGGWTGTGSYLVNTQYNLFHILDASDADEGSYQVTITTGCGSVTSGTVTLVVSGTCEPCPEDISPGPAGNGAIDVGDLLLVISSWGACANCPADIAPPGGNDLVNVEDLLAVISNWGACP